MERYKSIFEQKLEEKYGDFSKATDQWFDELVGISERYFEKGKGVPELYQLLGIAQQYRPRPGQGSTQKDFFKFKKNVLSVAKGMNALTGFAKFLLKLKPGMYDMDGAAKESGYDSYDQYEDMTNYGEVKPDRDIDDKEFKLWSNDEGGNSSVINSVMDLYSQAISYFGDLKDF